jgi:hypothetical protein
VKFRDDEWARRWESGHIERRRIARAVARGEAVADPCDASRFSLRRIERRAGEAHQKNEQLVQQL